jgi:riboflavin biosynthesis pyrimidine reductase
VLEGHFRRDINIQLVTKIIMEQLLRMLNPVVFPPEHYNLAEVFRSLYRYYIRGICTEGGARQAEAFFARNIG